MWAVPVPAVSVMKLPKFVSFSGSRMQLHLVPSGYSYDTNTSESLKTTRDAPVQVNNQPPELDALNVFSFVSLYRI